MAHAASVLSSSIKDATVREIITANKFTKILKSKDVVLSFPKIGDISKVALICFSDVSFANLKCGGSQGGMLVFLEGSDRFMLLAWQSQELKRVVKSTLTVETLALHEVIEVAYIRCLPLEIARTAKSDFAYKVFHS